MTRNDNAKSSGRNHRIRTRTMYVVRGYISGSWIETRISAPNKDAAEAIAHERGFRIVECVQLKQKQK